MFSATNLGSRPDQACDYLLAALQRALPQGGALAPEVWRSRHRGVLVLLYLHAIGIIAFGLAQGFGVALSVAEGAAVAAIALLADRLRASRRVRAAIASVGLVTCSAMVVHLSGGYIEFHFHFFVMIAVITLYQDWVSFLSAVAFVVLEHGLGGMLFPDVVYNHPDAIEHPWKWAALHGAFVLAESVACILNWRLTEHQTLHDSLTDLANRALFMDRLDHALARAARHRRKIAVLFLDLDNFKAVNDSLGHEAGDRLLLHVARRLRGCLRAEDTIARLGGDEFVVLIEDVSDVDGACIVADRVIAELQSPCAVGGRQVLVRASIGIALSGPDLRGPDELLRNADMAMYLAKGRRQGRYEVFEPNMHAAVLERAELKADLQRALEQGEFSLHYQPILNLATGRVSEVEALLRWSHPEKGAISPLEFISMAEETGLIVPLGQWVLEQACYQARAWQLAHSTEPPLVVSVNLSPWQLQHAGLPKDVARVLRETGLAPECLKLEITESAMVDEVGPAGDAVQALRQLGVKLAIDDFGTGYSSLSYLRRLPVDTLKIDRSFVDGLGADPGATAIVRSIVSLAKSLGLQLTAEGIETAEQLGYLRGLGCDRGQGYYFARPLAPEGIDALLAVPVGTPIVARDRPGAAA